MKLNSTTFEVVSNDVAGFVGKLQSKFGPQSSIKLPYLYASTKMHKTPVKFRHITAATDTFFSERSIAVSKCLNLLMKTANSSYHYKIKGLKNCIFFINSRDKVVQALNKSNRVKGKKLISTWDFSTLYTTIPLNKLKEKVAVFVRKIFSAVFKSKQSKFINCSTKSNTAYFTKNMGNNTNASHKSYSCDDLINEIGIIVDNSYIVFHNVIFRQKIGIPMGTNCAPFLANIFLHVYEYEYLQKLIQNGDIETARSLSNTFRYQDDCIALCDNNVFRDHYANIYPAEMNLENTNISPNVCTFLDLRISIFRGLFRYCSYDKRKNFDFNICNYPNLNGNVPIKSSYGVFTSQLVRYCDINLNIDTFFHDVKDMVYKFIKQGFEKNKLLDCFMKFMFHYTYKWSKFGTDIISYCHKIFI